MKRICLLLLIATAGSNFASAETITLESAPPVVVKTFPTAGATDVDPALTEIRVTFSKAMQDGGWSWSTWGEENFPAMTGNPRYLGDGRTCVLPVRLEPDKFYAIWLNSDKFQNFKDAGGRAAVPYLLTFFTTSKSASQLPGTTPKLTHSAQSVVDAAVTTISGCAEGDPRVGKALKSLQPFDQRDVVSALIPHLRSNKDTVRRSAVYILWNGGFADITAAVEPLRNLLQHKEDLTRGMAALALGQNRVTTSFDELVKMMKDDPSGYARRCAAYALGLLGDARATPVLETALKDPEAMVRGNAKAALDMIGTAQTSSPATDNINLPFVNDPQVLGEWESIDFVAKPSDFKPDKPAWSGDLYLKKLTFLENGKCPEPYLTWTKGVVIHHGDKTASRYETKEINGQSYMFFEWKSGDVTIRGQEPHYYVLKKKGSTNAEAAKDYSRAITLFNDIEDFGHEFDAAFAATNLAAAKTAVRRLTNMLTEFNAAMEGTDSQFPAAMFEDIAKLGQALEEANWDKARALALHKDEYAAVFRQISRRMADLALLQRLNAEQRAVFEWTDRQFRSYFDARTFEGLSKDERTALETRLLDELNGPRSREYYTAINSLAALQSKRAIEPLRRIAFDRADKDNRDRWMAIRALGLLGDKGSIPELIHLVYHGNINTRWWAQISLVRLTGQNFGKDWNAWGEWWNGQGGQPPFNQEIIRWWNGQPEPDKLAATLDENDKDFLEKLRVADSK